MIPRSRSGGAVAGWLGWIGALALAGAAVATVSSRDREPDPVPPHRETRGDDAARSVPPLPADAIGRLVADEEYVPAFRAAVARARDRLAAAGPDDPTTWDALEQVGEVAFRAGATAIADDVLSRLEREAAARFGSAHPPCRTLYLRGLALRLLFARDEAAQRFARARELLEPDPSRDDALLADVIQAQANWTRVRDLDRAVELYREALALRDADPRATELAIAVNLVWLGWTLHQAGRSEEAVPILDRAADILIASGRSRHSLMAVLIDLRASRLALRGEWAAAADLFEQAAAVYDFARKKHPPGFARRRSPRNGWLSLALVRLMLGRPEDAWTELQKGRGSINSDFLRLARWSEIEPETYAEVAALRRAEIEVRSSPRAPGTGSGSIGWNDLLRALDLRGRIFELEQRFLDRHRAPRLTVSDLRRRLEPGQAYVGWERVRLTASDRRPAGTAPAELWAYVIRREGIRWVALPEEEADEAARSADRALQDYLGLLRGATGWPERVEPDPELDARGRALGRTLVDPLLPTLEGVDTLIVELSGLVPSLPVEALPLADGSTLKDRFAVAYVPSAESLILLQDRARAGASSLLPALVVGHASAGGRDGLPPLPFSGQEVWRIAALLPGAEVLRDREASETALHRLTDLDGLARYGAIHVAAHVVDQSSSERSALVLAQPDPGGLDGRVEPAEILALWRLRAGIVVLSGCRSVVTLGEHDGGEHLGFSQNLLAAGAGSVVASLWEVDDEATALLMERFYENLTGRFDDARRGRVGPMPVAAALQEAQLWLRDRVDAGGRTPFGHPVYWAGFVLVGPPDRRFR